MTKPPNKPATMTKTADAPMAIDAGAATATSTEAPKTAIETTPATTAPTEASKAVISDVDSLSDGELEANLKLLRAEVRRRENAREASRPKVGSKVRILRGRPKFVGKEGTAVVVRKSRCFVAVPEINSPAYVLISDVELVER